MSKKITAFGLAVCLFLAGCNSSESKEKDVIRLDGNSSGQVEATGVQSGEGGGLTTTKADETPVKVISLTGDNKVDTWVCEHFRNLDEEHLRKLKIAYKPEDFEFVTPDESPDSVFCVQVYGTDVAFLPTHTPEGVEVTGYHGLRGTVIAPDNLFDIYMGYDNPFAVKDCADDIAHIWYKGIDYSGTAYNKCMTYHKSFDDIKGGMLLNDDGTKLIILKPELTNITDFVIPEGVVDICYKLSYTGDMSLITSLSLPSTLWNIEDYAFKGATNLTSVDFTTSDVRSIGLGAFEDCGLQGELVLPDTVGSDEGGRRWLVTPSLSGAFENCTGITSIKFSSNIPILELSCFSGTSITELTVPSIVEEVGQSVFSKCHSLTTVRFEEGCKKIGASSFKDCENLVEVLVPNSLEKLSAEAFRGCTSLKSVVIPDDCEVSTLHPYGDADDYAEGFAYIYKGTAYTYDKFEDLAEASKHERKSFF